MLLPQELKKHSFSRSLRGYTADEVEEYIAFVVSKYEALYRENDETGRKLALAVKSLEELRAREAKISALEAAIRKAAGEILAEAELKRRQIVADAEEYAARIVAEADAHVASQENQFLRLQKEAAAFRDSLFAAYSVHIDKLEELAAVSAEEAFTDPMPAAALADAAEEITPIAADTPEEEPAAEEEAAPADEDVYSEEELLDEPETEEEPDEAAADDSDKYELLPQTEDEDVYSEEELTDTELPFSVEIVEEKPDVEQTPDEESVLFATLFNEGSDDAQAETAAEEVPWQDEEDEEVEEIPAASNEKAPESEDDALLRELHEVFAREFAAVKKAPASTQAAENDNDDENLNELKKRMGITEEKTEKFDDFSFLSEDAAEEEPQKRGLFGKK